MAKKKLTEEQQKEIDMLIQNNKMLDKTRQEAIEKGNKTVVAQIERAQQEVIDHIKSIDSTVNATMSKSTSLSSKKKEVNNVSMFQDTDMSIYDMIQENDLNNKELEESSKQTTPTEVEWAENDLTPSETTSVNATTFNNVDGNQQYDVIPLPSNGQCYRNKVDRIPVAYLTAYDENIITSPNLYKDGLVIDYLLKSKIMNSEINVDDLVSGDADAVTLFLRATSYGPDFPIVVNDPDSGEQIDTTVDLTTLKPKDFKLIGDENGYFEYVTPIKKDKIKFRYLTRKQERQLKQVTELESYGTKAQMLDRERETLNAAIMSDKYITDNEKKTIKAAIKAMETWSKKLKEVNNSEFTRMVTNSMQLQVVAVNDNYDREFIRKYINNMPTRDAMMLRKYIGDNKPGINFDIEVQRPESLGGGSFKTFLNWDDTVFLNLPDV